MGVETPISVAEYLQTSYAPDCDFVDGYILERHVGKKRHSYAQGRAWSWFDRNATGFEPFVEQRIRVSPTRYRVPDVLVMKSPSPDEDVFTTAPYLCLEIMSPDDTMSSLQDRLDDYLSIAVPNIWVIDPWKRRAWIVTARGWQAAVDGAIQSADGLSTLPISEVML